MNLYPKRERLLARPTLPEQLYCSSCLHRVRTLVFVIIVLFVCGCGSVTTIPFEQFTQSLQELHKGAEDVLELDIKWTKDRFMRELDNGGTERFISLLLEPDDENPYVWRAENEPLFLKVQKTRQVLYELNTAFIQYACLLQELASGSLVDGEKFEKLARDLNNNVVSAANVMRLEIGTKERGIFSLTAVESARLYIEKQRRGYLRKAIEDNQDRVAEYTREVASVLELVASDIGVEYLDRRKTIVRDFKAATTPEQKRKKVEELITLNDQLIGAMNRLRTLDKSYRALPRAHNNLARAVGSNKVDYFAIRTLYDYAMRLQQFCTEEARTEKDEIK